MVMDITSAYPLSIAASIFAIISSAVWNFASSVVCAGIVAAMAKAANRVTISFFILSINSFVTKIRKIAIFVAGMFHV